MGPARSHAFGPGQPLDELDDAAAMDPRVTTTELTDLRLPVRVRQASLAPQLRNRSGFAASGNGPSGPSPEAARSTVSALQRGWERGRSASGTADPASGTVLSPEPLDEAGTARSDAADTARSDAADTARSDAADAARRDE